MKGKPFTLLKTVKNWLRASFFIIYLDKMKLRKTFTNRKLIAAGAIFFGITQIFIIGSLVLSKTSRALTVNPRLELTADPGGTILTDLKVTNEERQSRTFYLRTENFNAEDETGNPSFNLRREGLSTWIKAPLSITLGPGETINLPIEIEVPSTATPGGHYAAIFFLADPPDLANESGAVAISSKLGSLILLRVNGDFVQDANVLEFGTTEKQKFFSQLPVQFYFRFQNTGEDHLKPIGDIQISNLIGQSTKILTANTVEGSVLPKSVRKFTSVWKESGGKLKQEPIIDIPKTDPMPFWDAVNYQARHFTFGRYTAELELAFGTKELKSDRAEYVFYVIPWQLLSVAIPVIIIALYILRLLIKRYNRYIVNKAQKQK